MLKLMKQAKAAFSLLSADEIAKQASIPVHIGLVADGSGAYAEMEELLLPSTLPRPEWRQRMMQVHRANAVCAACHGRMDPIGFALESFDAVGKFRTVDENFEPLDTAGVYPDGSKIDGLAGLRQVLVNHSDQFLATMTRTLMTYALGRGVEYYDAPAVRGILRGAARNDNHFSSFIFGIVNSVPFQMRRIDS